jgi:hypothetical protein
LKAADAAGIKERTLETAKAELGITSGRVKFGLGSRSVWTLPPKSQPPTDT